MAQAKKKAQKAQNQAAELKARATPYARQIMADDDLRANITDAYMSARRAYGRLSNGKSPAKQIFDDKKLQKNLREAAWSAKDASVALREGPKKKRRGSGLGKLLLLAIVGSGIALAVSSGLRKKVLDALFGAEEEFEYTSTTTTPASPETTTPPTPSAS